jgi:hypothetical protein
MPEPDVRLSRDSRVGLISLTTNSISDWIYCENQRKCRAYGKNNLLSRSEFVVVLLG